MIKERLANSSDMVVTPETGEKKDILRETEERLMGQLRDYGERFYQEVEALGFPPRKGYANAREVKELAIKSNMEPNRNEWLIRISPDKEHILKRAVSWVVETRGERAGLRTRQRPFWQGNLEVEVHDFAGMFSHLQLRASGGDWEIKVRERKELETPIDFKEGQLTYIAQVALYSSDWQWPLVISSTERYFNGDIEMVMQYGEEIEENGMRGKILRPRRGNETLAIGFDYGDREEITPSTFEEVRQRMLDKKNKMTGLTEKLWEAFPREIDGIDFLERNFGIIFERTEQALNDLRASLS